MRKEGFAMRHILSVIVVATLLVATAVEVIAGWTKMDATRNHHYVAPITGISVALPSGMKSFPVELPQ
jgi:TRAP-type C4-dicarboxylate transport system permease small subunit